MEKSEGEESKFFGNFRKMVSVVDKLRDAGLHQHISLPRIAVLGTQSAGKSSVLEAVVGMNFLPRGAGVCTRRPLELRLEHNKDATQLPYGVFQGKKEEDKKIYDFNDIEKRIRELTDEVCGSGKAIIDDPILLKVVSPHCPDLTIIDIPGITQIAIGDQDLDIEKLTKNMCERYCKDERTIILCVIPANQDMSTSIGLQMARRLDKDGIRTIGVITKIDIMDEGTNARDMLLGKEIPLNLGYVGIKGRSQADINKGMSVREGLKKEQDYFARHKVYCNIPKDKLGTDSLVTKMTTVMYTHIRRVMPSIIKEIDQKIFECRTQLEELGSPLPVDKREKLLLLWKLISKFNDQFKVAITGEYNEKSAKVAKDLLGGARINLKFRELYLNELKHNFKASKTYENKEIQRMIRMHTGNRMPGFSSMDMFTALINPLLEKLKDPALSLVDEVHSILEQLAIHFINESFSRLPNFADECITAAMEAILEEKTKSKELIENILSAYLGYNYTKDPEYIAVILPDKDKLKLEQRQKKQEALEKKKAKEAKKRRLEAEEKGEEVEEEISKEQLKKEIEQEIEEEEKNQGIEQHKKKNQKETEQVLVTEMRKRIDTYFKVQARQLADIVPKFIGFYLVNAVVNNIHFKVYQKVSVSSTFDDIKEPPSILTRRETLKSMLDVLVESRKVMLRDPDLAYSLGASNSVECQMLAEKDKRRKTVLSKDNIKAFASKTADRTKETASLLADKTKEGAKYIGDGISSSINSVKEMFGSTNKPEPSPPKKESSKLKPSTTDLKTDLAKAAWDNRDKIPVATVVNAVKNNPELTAKIATEAVNQGANVMQDKERTKRNRGFGGLFG